MKYAKHIHVLHLLSAIPKPYIPDGSCYHTPAISREDAATTFDMMFTYILANFAKPAGACNGDALFDELPRTAQTKLESHMCHNMLAMEDIEAVLAEMPPYFAEEIFPVAVARYMLRELMLPISPCDCKTFSEFHNRYGLMVIESCTV